MSSTRTLVAMTVALFATLTSFGGYAQEETEFATESESQKQLNTKGVDAIIDGDYEKAIGLLQSSLNFGKLNVTYLNLGRALEKNGDCAAAMEAYENALTAPKVALPTPDEVASILEKYKTEMKVDTCPAMLRLACTPRQLKVSIDGGVPVVCPAEVVKLAPGPHTIIGEVGETTKEWEVTVAAMEERELAMEIEVVAAPENPDPPVDTPLPDPEMSMMKVWGWVLGGTGVAVLATATILDLAVLAPKVSDWEDAPGTESEKSDIETLQGVNLGLFIGGGVLVATGVVLLLLPTDDEQDTVAGHFSPLWGSDFMGLGWQTRW